MDGSKSSCLYEWTVKGLVFACFNNNPTACLQVICCNSKYLKLLWLNCLILLLSNQTCLSFSSSQNSYLNDLKNVPQRTSANWVEIDWSCVPFSQDTIMIWKYVVKMWNNAHMLLNKVRYSTYAHIIMVWIMTYVLIIVLFDFGLRLIQWFVNTVFLFIQSKHLSVHMTHVRFVFLSL